MKERALRFKHVYSQSIPPLLVQSKLEPHCIIYSVHGVSDSDVHDHRCIGNITRLYVQTVWPFWTSFYTACINYRLKQTNQISRVTMRSKWSLHLETGRWSGLRTGISLIDSTAVPVDKDIWNPKLLTCSLLTGILCKQVGIQWKCIHM